MEPHREEQPKAPQSGAGQKPKLFRILKLEERIAPATGGQHGTGHGNVTRGGCYYYTSTGCYW